MLNIKQSPLANRLQEMFKPIKKRATQVMTLEVRARDIDFVRAEVFLDDMYKLTGEDPDNLLSVNSLILLLYEDFLMQIRSQYDSVQMIERLIEKRLFYFRKREIDESDQILIKSKWAILKLPMKRNMVLRGEVFLHDLGLESPKFEMKLEELMSILFMDFMKEVRKGNQRKLIKSILTCMKEWQ
ncbi:hypothetical protein M5X00_13355 [Paenibacillus alvei]|uniref:hypothetical protein n=2 Tax=Paenibacillus alvei TaxID=44250 RepID=UPI00227D9988|nr:hypothetical protein [Paenibacillus alvei]MCY9540489.1 hypothetical protein [Paenibacillus alvei]MCY9708306.1 hypothetical protein [Paenibacillus alvei]MCY9733006.1 hypothetical protein [Paenibacillus alvei]MCY9755228.1 hypothetical protein [Paenibacillus alvei]MEC0080294.1 hypothetical protein [Paenibacillus alvei]